MFYSDEVIMDVRSGNDIVDVIGSYVKLTRKGANYFGLCPFHNEKTPSFSVSREKQIYRCFGCGAGGNVIKFVEEKENLSFPEAIEFLAGRINYKLPENKPSRDDAQRQAAKEKLWEMHKTAARFYYECLNSDMGRRAREYLAERKVEKKIANKFGLGYSPDSWDSLNKHLLEKGFDQDMILRSGLVNKGKSGNFYDKFRDRLMFPIIDVRGNIIAFAGRELEKSGGAKYLNSPETEIYKKSFNPYNLNLARLSNQKEFILVEGYMDVISLYQAGFKNAIALCGTAMNDHHTSVIKRYKQEMILLLDSDDAGERAVLKAIPVLLRAGIRPKVLQVKNAKDPDEFIKKYGAEGFARLLKTAVNHTVFRINVLKKQYKKDDPDDRVAFVNEVVQILSEIENNIELDVYIGEVARDTGVSPEVLKAETARLRGNSDAEKDGVVQLGPRVKNVIVNNAMEDAKNCLIDLISSDKIMFEKARAVIDKSELADELYIRLFSVIEELYKQNRPIREADVMTMLDESDAREQSRVALIFMGRRPYDSSEQKYNALFGCVKEIKKAYLTQMIESETDDDKVMQLLEESKNLDSYLKDKLK